MNTSESHQLFEKLPPTKLFFRCAVPSMVSMAVTSLYVVADGIFVGRLIGAGALAAVNLVMPFIMMSFALSDMVAVGSSVQISIRLGEGRRKEASRIFSVSCAVIMALSVIVGAAAFFGAGPLVRLLGADEAVAGLAVEYMRVYAMFSPLIMIFFAVDNYLRICGKVHYSMWMNVGISLGNILLDWLFLARFGWGIGGAALASCLCLACGTLLCFLPFFGRKLALRFTAPRVPLRVVGNILANGSSEFFSNITGSVLMVMFNAVLLRISGSLAVAAFSIVMYVDSIVKSMLYGMTDSMQPAVSYNFGAGNRKRVFALECHVIGACFLVSVAVMIWMLTGGQSVSGMFVAAGEPELLEMSARAMRLFSVSYLVGWFGLVCGSFFTALNRPVFSLAVSFSQTLLFPAACLAALPAFWGLDGVWLTPLLSGALAALLAAFLLAVVVKNLRRPHPKQIPSGGCPTRE